MQIFCINVTQIWLSLRPPIFNSLMTQILARLSHDYFKPIANTKGGVILFGVEDKCGKLVGLSYDEIQVISRELGNAANEQVRPTIYIETEVVRVEEKHLWRTDTCRLSVFR